MLKAIICFLITSFLLVNIGCTKQYTRGERILKYGKVQKRERIENGQRILEVKQSRTIERNFYYAPAYLSSPSVTRNGILGIVLTPVGVVHGGVLIATDNLYGKERMKVPGEWEFAGYVEETGEVENYEPVVRENVQRPTIEPRKEPLEEPTASIASMKKWLFSGTMLTRTQFHEVMKLPTTDSILDLLEENPDSSVSLQLLYFKTGNRSKALAILAVQLAYKYKLKIDRVLITEHLPAVILNNQTISASFTTYEEYLERMKENGKNIKKN